MGNTIYLACGIFVLIIALSCINDTSKKNTSTDSSFAKGIYASDVAFLKKHTKNLIELNDKEGNSKVCLSADFQGRVMTSTATGDSGKSFGWLNYNLIAASEKRKQFNPVGGEERFWMGPEGGQFSIYFRAGDSFNIKNWQVPAFIDTTAYNITGTDPSQVIFSKKATFINYSGTTFNINIDRKINLIDKNEASEKLNATIPGNIHFVGYKTENRITNTGDSGWTKEKGLLSVWLLGMFTPTPRTIVIIPFHPQSNSRSLITDNYFGSIPSERLLVKDSFLFFVCDGKYRSKIGLSPSIAKPLAASYDFQENVLTLIIPEIDKKAPYVNSKWEIQDQPYHGDVINSYNDGPLADGSQLGPFYEIESSSPALALKKNETGVYTQITCHLQGDYDTLKKLALQILGINLDEIKK